MTVTNESEISVDAVASETQVPITASPAEEFVPCLHCGKNTPSVLDAEQIKSIGKLRSQPQKIVNIPPKGIPLEDIERNALLEALRMCDWVQVDAAELLSISPRVMNYKIKTLGLEFPRHRRSQK